MATADSSAFEPQSLRTGVGCAFIVPAAVFGTAMLVEDHLMSADWHLLAEVLGWWMICVGVSVGCAILISHFHAPGRGRYGFLAASIAAAVAFTLLIVGVAHPGTPNWLKEAFISLLQIIGIVTVPAMAAYLGWIGWKSRRS